MSKKIKPRSDSRKEALNDENNENLGLDADGSSEDVSIFSNLNNDNDRISGNPDGEDDQNNTNELPGHSLLDEK